jgi:hypothetical protein
MTIPLTEGNDWTRYYQARNLLRTNTVTALDSMDNILVFNMPRRGS